MNKFSAAFDAVALACIPDRRLVKIEVGDYLSTWPSRDRYDLRLKDTNRARHKGWRTADSYKVPGADLCPPGHVPVAWLYIPMANPPTSAMGILTRDALDKVLAELCRNSDAPLNDVAVHVRPIMLTVRGTREQRIIMSMSRVDADSVEASP